MLGRIRRLCTALVVVPAVVFVSSPAVAAPQDVPGATAAAPASPGCVGDGPTTAPDPARCDAAGETGADTSDSASSGEGILLSREELMALPTSGPAWNAIMARVEDPFGGSYRLGSRDDSNKDVLAHALAGARLDDAALKGFVRDKIDELTTARRDKKDVLGTLRHLQTYVISADLIDLASFDADLDARFREWLAAEIRADYTGGGGGGSVISTHDRKPNNFGTHAGATRIAAALYLGDDEELRAARDVWYGWATGDPEYVPADRIWTGTDWQCDEDRPVGINPDGCMRDGNSIDGVLPEDQERCGDYDWPPCETNYIHGATDGMTLAFWMLARQGENPWEWGDRAALRQMEWKYEVGQPPYDGYRWQIPVIEAAYGVDLAGNDATATSTNFGYADWWAGAEITPRNPGIPGISSNPGDSADPGGPGGPGEPGDGGSDGIAWSIVAALALLLVGSVIEFIRRRRTTHTSE
jgi:hypothetical protein